MKRQVKFGIVVAVVVVSIAYLIYAGIQTGSMYYFTVSEFTSQRAEVEGERVRVNGNIVAGSVHFDVENLDLSFTLQDEESGDTLGVSYHGAPPDLLEEEGVSIVVEGYYDTRKNVFDAKNLLVKCPSKYEKEEDPQEA